MLVLLVQLRRLVPQSRVLRIQRLRLLSWASHQSTRQVAQPLCFLKKNGHPQDGAPKIAKLVYKWLNNGLW